MLPATDTLGVYQDVPEGRKKRIEKRPRRMQLTAESLIMIMLKPRSRPLSIHQTAIR